jgi:3-oxoacyl-[acyl-carrier protein] reductase
LAGLNAVVTGASSGIGRAIAETYAAEGAVVLVTHRDSPERAREVADAIAARGGRALVRQADLATRDACERLVAETRDELGRVDVWVNNAGADVLTGEAAAWEWERKLDTLLAVDLKGTIACSYAIGEVMRNQERGGTIVNMSWDHVATGMAGDDPQLFAAVKGGVLAFSKSLARSLAPDVRVNVLCPGRWGRPQDVADAALYLASPAAAFVTGQAINVNGGVVM